MPFTPPPLVPDWQPGNGSRLVTDRYDFEAHLEGTNPPYATNFRHTADQTDLLDSSQQRGGMLIDGYTVYNVQEALQLLANIVSPPDIRPATVASLGIVQLAGDIAGIATSVLVKGLQGRPINSSVPVSGQVLTWTGSAWGPVNPSNAVVFSGDLAGPNAGPQQVIGITGVAQSGFFTGLTGANVHGNGFFFDASLPGGAPAFITQTPTTTGNAGIMAIEAQTSTVGNGGNLYLAGGQGQEVPGVVILSDGFGNQTMQIGNINGRFSALNLTGTAGSGDMPFGTGDLVTLINNAASNPSVGSPDGPILYGNGGNLWVMQTNAVSFQVGSIPNPSLWGTAPSGFTGSSFTNGGFTYTARSTVTTSNASPGVGNLFSFTLPSNIAVRVDAIIVGRNTANGDTAQFNLSLGYTNFSGTTTAIGTMTNADPRYSGSASSWTATPVINNSGSSIRVTSGGNASTNIVWTTSVQLIFG